MKPMYLLEVHQGLLSDPPQLVAAHHGGWTLLTPCTDNLFLIDSKGNKQEYSLDQVVAVCPLFLEASDFEDDEFREFQILLKTIFQTAQSGHDWPKVMNKQVHQAGDIVVQRSSGKHETFCIIQFGKKKTLIRLHTFLNAFGRKVCLLSHVFLKPGNSEKTPASEQARAKQNLKEFLHALDAGTAQLIDAQGGRDGFLKMV